MAWLAVEQTQLWRQDRCHTGRAERDRLRADLDKLKAARRAARLEAKTRAEATTLLGEVEADDDDAFHRSVKAFRSAVDHGLDALGAEDKQSIWDGNLSTDRVHGTRSLRT